MTGRGTPRERALAALSEAVGRYGSGLADDPRRVEAILRDTAGQHKAEVAVLSVAAAEGVGAALLQSSQGLQADLVERLSRRLQDNRAVASDAARWAVEAWATALGIQAAIGDAAEDSRQPPPAATTAAAPAPVSPPAPPPAPPPLPDPPPRENPQATVGVGESVDSADGQATNGGAPVSARDGDAVTVSDAPRVGGAIVWAAGALVVGALLPWIRGASGFEVPLSLLWDSDTDDFPLRVGMLLLVLAAGLWVAASKPWARTGKRLIGFAVVAVTALTVFQDWRYWEEFELGRYGLGVLVTAGAGVFLTVHSFRASVPDTAELEPMDSTPAPPTVEGREAADAAPASAGTSLLPLVSAVAIGVSAGLSWLDEVNAMDVPVGFLIDVEALHDLGVGWFRLGIPLVLIGAVAVASVLLPRFARYRRGSAVAAVAVAVVFLVQLVRFDLDHDAYDMASAFAHLFSEEFGIGPWLALVAGVTLWVKGGARVPVDG